MSQINEEFNYSSITKKYKLNTKINIWKKIIIFIKNVLNVIRRKL